MVKMLRLTILDLIQPKNVLRVLPKEYQKEDIISPMT